ncbi:MAG: NAD(P)/FAD-dependent oxidoreductase [Chthoniobacterales bacterium]|jgi:flavin-dependent dehydrogenase
MQEARPVEIIGGGLAGLALGLGLRARGVPVTLREAGSYPRHRVCGEFMTGLDEATRRSLQLDAALENARPATRVSWFDRRGEVLSHQLPEPALCLSRCTLDARLAADFIRLGGDLVTTQRVVSSPGEGRVLACGAKPDPQSRWIGLKQHFHHLELAADLEVHLGRGAYIGLTKVDDFTTNVCGLFPRPGSGQPCTLIDCVTASGLTELARRLSAAHVVEGSACAVAGLNYASTTATPDSLALGDRQGLIPPFTGHGMTIALQSAASALAPLVTWSRREADWATTTNAVRRDLARRFHHRLGWARRFHPWLLHPPTQWLLGQVGRSGLVPFSALYRLTH